MRSVIRTRKRCVRALACISSTILNLRLRSRWITWILVDGCGTSRAGHERFTFAEVVIAVRRCVFMVQVTVDGGAMIVMVHNAVAAHVLVACWMLVARRLGVGIGQTSIVHLRLLVAAMQISLISHVARV